MRSHYRAIAALLLGFVLGGLPAGFYYGRFFKEISERWVFVNHTSRISSDVNNLIALRGGDIDYVISVMEEDLSSEISNLSIDDCKGALSQKASLRILRRAALYRSQHPYKTGDVAKDRLVEGMLTEANGHSRSGAPASIVEEKSSTGK
jgi:hypothetical protein